jgi:L-aminopeptidase/D-esterase-like protein
MPSLTDVPGIRVGHATDVAGITGCTVVLCEAGAIISGEVRGAAPGTRETDIFQPANLVQHAHGVLLTGGSAFGLAAATGVERYLEERGVGYNVGAARVPIVPAAVLFDLAIGDPAARPTPEMAYEACRRASSDPVEEGCVGAGTGATVGKLLAMAGAMKGGVGSWSITLPDDTIVGAIAAVNALGDVVDDRGAILAGARGPGGQFIRTSHALRSTAPLIGFGTNTTLALIATSATLTKAQAWRLAVQGHAGISRAVLPSHTLYDGDTVFVLATGRHPAPPGEAALIRLGEAAAQTVAESIRRAVGAARSLGGVPGRADSPPGA